MENKKFIQRRIGQYYWQHNLNCATASLKILSEKFRIPLCEQVIDAAAGMHGAGCHGAQCGLVEGTLMFLGILGRMANIDDDKTKQSCRNFARQFEKNFTSLQCSDLRPGGFNDDDPPHLCESLSKRAILLSIDFIEQLPHRPQRGKTDQAKQPDSCRPLSGPAPDTIPVRTAEVGDISSLAVHHRKMFEEIWRKKGNLLDDRLLVQVEQAYAEKLTKQFAEGSCRAWVAVDSGTIIASGAVTIISFVPTPQDLSHQLGYLHSLYTEERYRGQHCAHRIIDQAIAFCREKGIRRIILTASEEGRPIYHAIGFRAAPELMRLVLGQQ